MKKKKIIVLIIILLLVLILGAAGTFAFLYMKTDFLKSNEQLFNKYLLQNKNISSILNVEIIEEQNELSKQNSYISTGNLVAVMKDEEGNEEQIDIATEIKKDYDNKKTALDATLKKDKEDLLKLSYVNDDDIYAIKCEDVYKYFIGVRNADLKQFARNMGLSETEIAQIPDTISFENIGLTERNEVISKEDLEYLYNTYLPIITGNISEEKYSKIEEHSLTIGNSDDGEAITYNKVVGYSLKLNQDDIKQMIISVLTKASEDDSTIKILEKILTSSGATEEQILQIDFKEIIKQYIEAIQNTSIEEFEIEILVYQYNGNIIRTKLKINDEMNITFDVLDNKEDFQNVLISINIIEPESYEENNQIENILIKIQIQKRVYEDGMDYFSKIKVNYGEQDYEANIESSFDNNYNNGIRNISNVTIKDYYKNQIDVSYENIIKFTDDELEIQELNNTNTVTINNYTIEQLQPFLEKIGNKYGETFIKTFEELEIEIEDEKEAMKYIQGIEAAVLALINTSGLPPVASTTAATVCTISNAINFLEMQMMEEMFLEEETEISAIQSKVTLAEANLKIDMSNGENLTSKKVLSRLQEMFGEEYEITAEKDLKIDTDNCEIKGTILIEANNGNTYKANFPNGTVEKVD